MNTYNAFIERNIKHTQNPMTGVVGPLQDFEHVWCFFEHHCRTLGLFNVSFYECIVCIHCIINQLSSILLCSDWLDVKLRTLGFISDWFFAICQLFTGFVKRNWRDKFLNLYWDNSLQLNVCVWMVRCADGWKLKNSLSTESI